MSENLDRVCGIALSHAHNANLDDDDTKAIIAATDALRAEFAELERKAEVLDRLRKCAVGELLAKLDSLAKGGTNADDQG